MIAPRYRVVAPTQRYFGSHPWPDDGQNFSIQAHADDLAAFIRALELDAVTVVGWSYGGAVSLTMTAQHPQLVKSLFLYDPALLTIVADTADSERALEDRLDMMRAANMAVTEGDIDGALKTYMDGVNDRDGDFEQLPDRVRALMRESGQMLPLLFAGPPLPQVTCADLGRLGIPACVAVGEDSRVFYKITAEAASRCLPSAELITVPRARHLWPIQDPVAFSRLVLDFLDKG
jgi:pimeloyl-ACP methyl ester carboxylesterase